MVIHDLDVLCVPIAPYEAEPPLVIDSNAVLAFAVALQGLQSVRGREAEIIQAESCIDGVKLHKRTLLNVTRKFPSELTPEDFFCLGITKRPNHASR